VSDAGWWGDAADQFKRRWEGDRDGIAALVAVIEVTSVTVDALANDLSVVENELETAAALARKNGVLVAHDGKLAPSIAAPSWVPPAAMLQYANAYNALMERAREARQLAWRRLAGLGVPDRAGLGPGDVATLGDASGTIADASGFGDWARDIRLLRPFASAMEAVPGLGLIGSLFATQDDVQKGDDWTSAGMKEAIAPIAETGTFIVAGGLAVALLPADAVAVGVGAAGVLAVGIGLSFAAGVQEHWDEDVAQYGLGGGIARGVGNTFARAGGNVKGLGGKAMNTAANVWHGIFG
jgi:hypothetical protein